MGDLPEAANGLKVSKLPHHKQQKLCTTRATYRQGRKLTAVKVYTINDESTYLLINHIPDIKLETELTNMCRKFGKLERIVPLTDYPHEQFETTYLVKYSTLKCTRMAKKILDGKNFFGGILHVCYAPELETVDETRKKLSERRKEFSVFKYKNRVKKYPSSTSNKSVKSSLIKDSNAIGVNISKSDTPFTSSSSTTYNVNNITAVTTIKLNQSIYNPNNNVENISKNKVSNKKSIEKDIDFRKLNKRKLISNKIGSSNNKKRHTASVVKNHSQPCIEDLNKPVSTTRIK